MNQNKGNQNNTITKIKYMLTKQDSANYRKNEKEEKEPELLGSLPVGAAIHPDALLED